MRRLIFSLVAVCVAAVLTGSAATAKNGKGVMCVLHAKLAAKNETTGSTSTAKGHTLIKVRQDGTIEFKTKILNKSHETFVAGHIHQAPAIEQDGVRERPAHVDAEHGHRPILANMPGCSGSPPRPFSPRPESPSPTQPPSSSRGSGR